MNKQDLQPLKGFRDFLPEVAKKRQYAIDKIKATFTKYGFEPLETPTLERQSLLLGKYGDEADKLVYTFEDEGGRKVGLRYDQTVPTSRVIAMWQENLSLPFKRFQVQPVWRAEKPQKGRYREFLQCDIDTFGTNSVLADAEIIVTAINSLKALGFTGLKMLINSRESLFQTISDAGIKDQDALTTIQSIDKLDKQSETEVKAELLKKGLNSSTIEKLFKLLKEKEPDEQTTKIIDYSISMGLTKEELEFSPILARGLDYYTGSIFEIKSTDYQGGSLGGGGRYDKLIGQLSGKDIPAVGLALGFDRIIDAMTDLELFPKSITSTTALVTVFSEQLIPDSLNLLPKLQSEGITTQLYPDATIKLPKQFKYADKKSIPFVIVIGEQESKAGTYTLKNLQTGTQSELSLDKLISTLNQFQQTQT